MKVIIWLDANPGALAMLTLLNYRPRNLYAQNTIL